ncbi:MAG: helix-turn-helix transcriptional regulator [Candidatus Helarchaeota archaeon]|nr:helix-turn-helix transcriptional regulator [Candidatus Helarchaeota archaeon]
MIKRVREFGETAFITLKRDFLENFESEILRGISTLTILSIINEYGDQGTYGYEILKNLQEKTKMLVIEDGTLYPILKKLQREGLVEPEKKEIGGRKRTYYTLTNEGRKVYYHIQGFFTKLVESIAPLMDVSVSLKSDLFLYCPNCSNKIDLRDEPRFCEVCGLNIEDYKEA